MAKRRRTMQQSKKQGRKQGTRNPVRDRVWPAFLLLGLLGAMMIAVINARAPGGELNAQGLRVSGEGRSDASHVVPPEQFRQPRVRQAYAIAQRIPETMNRLYCWCGCIERGMRSALECFESDHGANCEVCLGTAEVAGERTGQGVTDAGRIQKAVDARYGRVPYRRS